MSEKGKIFIAAPISAFEKKEDYNECKENILKLIQKLRIKYEVYSEIELIDNGNDYDTPEISLKKDLSRIEDSDVFIWYHPLKIQSSALIELGYALAKRKILVIISNINNLPYLAKGIINSYLKKYYINTNIINEFVINDVFNYISTVLIKQ